MILRIGLGALLSAVVLMLWGYLFWIVLGVPQGVLRPLPAGDPLTNALKAKGMTTGAYVYPARPSEEALKDRSRWNAYVEQSRRGPLVQLFYAREGADPISTTLAARGLLHFFVSSLLAAALLAVASPRLKRYGSRVGFVVLLGLFATVLVNLGAPIWFHHPWDYHLLMAAVDCFNALLMGIVLAAVVKPGPGPYWSLDGK
jgi:lipopolysaccharide export LptBFGC system permease protein LptF